MFEIIIIATTLVTLISGFFSVSTSVRTSSAIICTTIVTFSDIAFMLNTYDTSIVSTSIEIISTVHIIVSS